MRRYRKEYWPELEMDLKKLLIEERSKGRRVSIVRIRLKAAETVNQNRITDFKGSTRWCFKFMKRHR